jgi:hypothetical protein
MCLHLSGWNLNSHVSLHSSSLVKSSCSIVESSIDLIILNILVSSANKSGIGDLHVDPKDTKSKKTDKGRTI